MDAATQTLIAGGMGVTAGGFLLGIGMIATRSKAARAPRYLLAAHLAAIIQGGLLLALTVAVGFSNLSAGVETTAAGLLVAGMVLFDLGLALNWARGVQDGFSEKSVGNRISAAGTPLVLTGFGILVYGVVMAL